MSNSGTPSGPSGETTPSTKPASGPSSTGPSTGSGSTRSTPPPSSSSGKGTAAPTSDPLRGSKASGLWAAVVGAGIVLVLLVIFIAQNTDPVQISYLGFNGDFPLSVIVLVATAVGILLTAIIGSLRIVQLRRRVKKEKKKR